MRGMIKTMDFGPNVAMLNVVRHTLNTLWELFDDDGSGDIDMNEFVRPDGLADLIVVQMDMLKKEAKKAVTDQEDGKEEDENVLVALKTIFKEYDTDDSGKIGPEELEWLLRDLGFDVDDVILSDILRRVDTKMMARLIYGR